jgi:hypothetical protein
LGQETNSWDFFGGNFENVIHFWHTIVHYTIFWYRTNLTSGYFYNIILVGFHSANPEYIGYKDIHKCYSNNALLTGTISKQK